MRSDHGTAARRPPLHKARTTVCHTRSHYSTGWIRTMLLRSGLTGTVAQGERIERTRERRAGLTPAPVLLVTPWFPPSSGGVAEVAERLRRGLIQAGVETHLLIGGGSRGRGLIPHPSLRNTHYVTVPGAILTQLTPRAIAGALLHGLPQLVRLLRHAKKRQIGSVVLIYPTEFAWPFLLVKRLQGVRLIVSLHGNDVEQYRRYPPRIRWLLRTVLGLTDAITVCAPHLGEVARAIQPAAILPQRNERRTSSKPSLLPKCL